MKKGVRLTLMFCLIFIVLALFGLVVYFNELSLTGKAVLSQYRGSNFSAPFDFFAEGTPQIFNIVPDVFSLSSGAGQWVEFNLSMNFSWVDGQDLPSFFKIGHIWDYGTCNWLDYSWSEPADDNGWIYADVYKSVNKSFRINASNRFLDGKNYALAYACRKVNGAWKCGCEYANDTYCNRWMLVTFNVTGANWTIPTACGDCVVDTDCSANQVCNNYRCAPATVCNNNTDCTGNRPVCDVSVPANKKRVECLVDYDCGSGKTCTSNVCIVVETNYTAPSNYYALQFFDSFDNLNNWTILSGTWSANGILYKDSTGHEAIIAKGITASEGIIITGIKPSMLGNYNGIIFRVQNNSNYYFAVLHRDDNRIVLMKRENGIDIELNSVSVGFDNSWHDMIVKYVTENNGMNVKIWYDGQLSMNSTIISPVFLNGSIGARAYYGTPQGNRDYSGQWDYLSFSDVLINEEDSSIAPPVIPPAMPSSGGLVVPLLVNKVVNVTELVPTSGFIIGPTSSMQIPLDYPNWDSNDFYMLYDIFEGQIYYDYENYNLYSAPAAQLVLSVWNIGETGEDLSLTARDVYVTYTPGRTTIKVCLPAMTLSAEGPEIKYFYVASDGSTYYNSGLTSLARKC